MTQLVLVKTKAELVKVGKHKLARSALGYKSKFLFDHLEEHLMTVSDKWCDIGCLASTMFGRNCASNRQAIRRRLSMSFRYLLDRGVFIVMDKYKFGEGHHGEIKAVKILEPTEGPSAEKQLAQVQLESMLRRKEINEERYNKAIEFLK